jgi:hypothetical protein
MTSKLNINIRRVFPLTDHEDASVAGLYQVEFDQKARGLPLSKLAGIALDVLHTNIPIGVLDDFEIDVIDDETKLIAPAPEHEEYSGSQLGTIEKISEKPAYIPEKDVSCTPGWLEDRYNPDGDGEHPTFTRDRWVEAVAAKATLGGYWEWTSEQIVGAAPFSG